MLNGVSVLANGYIIRMLGEDGYGSLVVALGLTGATTIVSNLGMRALYTKAVAGADNATTEVLMAEQLGLRLRLAILAGVVAGAAAWLLYPGDRVVLYCTILQSVGLLATISWTVMADVLNAREEFRANASITFWAGLVLTILSTLTVAIGGGAVAVAAAYVIGPLVNLSMQYRAVTAMGIRVHLGRAAPGRYRTLLRESRALAANDIMNVANSRAEGVWAPLLFGKELMGVYSAGTLPQSRLGMVSDGVTTAHFSAMAQAHSRGDKGAVADHASGMFTLLLAASLPLALFTLVGAPYLGTLLFPAAAQSASSDLATFVTRVSSLAIPLTAISLGIRYSLQAVGQHSRNAKDQMKATTIGLFLVLALALTLGVPGLIIGLVCKTLLSVLMQGRTFLAHFPTLLDRIPFAALGAVATMLSAYLALTIGTDGELSLPRAMAFGSLGAIGYVVLAYKSGLVARQRRVEG